MKHFLSSLLLLTGLVAATACSKKDDTVAPAQTSFALSGNLTGAQSVPATPSTATGAVSGTYDKNTKVLTYSVSYTGITPTGAHFHLGSPTTSKGPVTVAFDKNNAAKDGFVSPITGTTKLDATQETAFLNNGIYANLHSTSYPADGEIRCQVAAK